MQSTHFKLAFVGAVVATFLLRESYYTHGANFVYHLLCSSLNVRLMVDV